MWLFSMGNIYNNYYQHLIQGHLHTRTNALLLPTSSYGLFINLLHPIKLAKLILNCSVVCPQVPARNGYTLCTYHGVELEN